MSAVPGWQEGQCCPFPQLGAPRCRVPGGTPMGSADASPALAPSFPENLAAFSFPCHSPVFSSKGFVCPYPEVVWRKGPSIWVPAASWAPSFLVTSPQHPWNAESSALKKRCNRLKYSRPLGSTEHWFQDPHKYWNPVSSELFISGTYTPPPIYFRSSLSYL